MCVEFGLCRYLSLYLRSPSGDIEDLISYPVPRASDEYTC